MATCFVKKTFKKYKSFLNNLKPKKVAMLLNVNLHHAI